MKPFHVKSSIYILILLKKIMKDILNLKLVILLEYQNIFAKGYAPNWSEEVFVIKKVKKNCAMYLCYY